MTTDLPRRNLDVLRAIAVLHVLIFHTINTFIDAPYLRSLGAIGVQLFFVHTALVLMSSLERLSNDDHRPPRAAWVREFYVKRALRIYPLSIVAILAVVWFNLPPSSTMAGKIVEYEPSRTLANVVANLLLVQNVVDQPSVIGVLWSLPIEVQMYAVLPLCFLLARRGESYMIGMLIAALIVGAAVMWAPIRGLWRLPIGTFAPCFMGGVAAYWLLRHRPMRNRWPAWTWPIIVTGFGIGCGWVLRFQHHFLLGWIVALGIGMLVPRVRELPESIATRAAYIIAEYSYGIYLIHLPALAIVFKVLELNPHTLLPWLLFTVLMVALPWMAYHFVEKPFVMIGKRLYDKPSSEVDPSSAAGSSPP